MSHVLITGGAGFIGSHLADDLLELGYEVTVFDNLSPQVHGDAEVDVDGWPIYLDRRARRVYGDVLDADAFEAALTGVTHLVHLAASVGVGQSMTNIVDYTRNNVMGAAVILETLSRKPHQVRRMTVASSMSVYGEGAYCSPGANTLAFPPLRDREQLAARQWEIMLEGVELEPMPTSETKLLQPASIYAVNKRDHEEMFLAVGRALQIPTVALRLWNAYGSRQALSNPYTGVAAIFISRLLNGQAPLVFEDGEQRRDFVHVKDVTAAFVASLQTEKAIWESYNVGSGQPTTVNDMARLLARLLDKEVTPIVLNKYRVGDVRHCFCDISKIRADLGFQPRHKLDAGMEELIAWVAAVKPPIDRSERSLQELQRSKLVV